MKSESVVTIFHFLCCVCICVEQTDIIVAFDFRIFRYSSATASRKFGAEGFEGGGRRQKREWQSWRPIRSCRTSKRTLFVSMVFGHGVFSLVCLLAVLLQCSLSCCWPYCAERKDDNDSDSEVVSTKLIRKFTDACQKTPLFLLFWGSLSFSTQVPSFTPAN